MKLFAIELRTVAIVQAETEADAISIAEDDQSDILSDAMDLEFNIEGQVKSAADLPRHGWDEQCIPYGGDGNTTVGEILEQIAAEPEQRERCPHTQELPL
jgi:hypothetical protein